MRMNKTLELFGKVILCILSIAFTLIGVACDIEGKEDVGTIPLAIGLLFAWLFYRLWKRSKGQP